MAENCAKAGIWGSVRLMSHSPAGTCSTDKCDGVEVPPVVGLAAMDRAAIAEEGLWLGVGATAEVVDAADAGPCQARRDVAGEIEQRVAGAWRALEEALIAGVVVGELRDKLRPHLIVLLPDHRAERSHDAGTIGAALLHRSDGRFGNTGERAAPASMRGANHAGLGIGEQDRTAVRRADCDREPCCARDDGVGLRT